MSKNAQTVRKRKADWWKLSWLGLATGSWCGTHSSALVFSCQRSAIAQDTKLRQGHSVSMMDQEKNKTSLSGITSNYSISLTSSFHLLDKNFLDCQSEKSLLPHSIQSTEKYRTLSPLQSHLTQGQILNLPTEMSHSSPGARSSSLQTPGMFLVILAGRCWHLGIEVMYKIKKTASNSTKYKSYSTFLMAYKAGIINLYTMMLIGALNPLIRTHLHVCYHKLKIIFWWKHFLSSWKVHSWFPSEELRRPFVQAPVFWQLSFNKRINPIFHSADKAFNASLGWQQGTSTPGTCWTQGCFIHFRS